MDDKNWTEENQKEYEYFLRKFCHKFEKSMEETGNRHGYVFMFVREARKGYIDIANNMNAESTIFALEEAIRLLKGEKDND